MGEHRTTPTTTAAAPDGCWTYNGAICEYVVGADSSQCYSSSFECEAEHRTTPTTTTAAPDGCWTYNGAICEYLEYAVGSQCYSSSFECEAQNRKLSDSS